MHIIFANAYNELCTLILWKLCWRLPQQAEKWEE